jgi:hypothetical protein
MHRSPIIAVAVSFALVIAACSGSIRSGSLVTSGPPPVNAPAVVPAEPAQETVATVATPPSALERTIDALLPLALFAGTAVGGFALTLAAAGAIASRH